MPSLPTLSAGVIAGLHRRLNAHDADAILTSFAFDAYVSAQRGEYVGTDAVRRFIQLEIVDDNVTMAVREVVAHHGDTILRVLYDGDYDKTNLPEEVVLSNYFSVRDGKIISLIIRLSQPAD